MNKGYKELVDYVEEGKWQIFGTLTFRYDVDFRQAEKTLNTFWNIVDRKLFGNLSYRKNIRTKRICVLQTGKLNNNKHIHFVANTIEGVDVDDFKSILKFLWVNKIKTAVQHMRIEKVKNLQATSKYLLHEYGKLGTDTLATTCSNI
jgi:hypothetical protein